MSDSSRLFFAIVLGASATAALLAGIVPLLASRAERPGAAAWLTALLAWLAGAVWAATHRALRPWHAAVAFVVAAVVSQLGGPVARAVGSVSVAGGVALSALRLVGVVRFAAAGAGWLPWRYAMITGAADVLVALGAIALLFRASARAVKVWSAVSLATLAIGYGLQTVLVRPLPVFEALYDAFLLPLFAVAAVAAWRAAGSIEAPSGE